MKGIKIIESNYDEKTGVSRTVIQTPLGHFSGTSTLLESDRETLGSKFAGCRIAEIKATLKYYKAERRIVEAQFKALDNLLFCLPASSCHGDRKFLRAYGIYKSKYLRKIDKIDNIIDELNFAIERERNRTETDFTIAKNKLLEKTEKARKKTEAAIKHIKELETKYHKKQS